MYTIEVNYETGNSFQNEDETNVIGLVWENKDLARKALQSLKEHYKLYQDQDSSSNRYTKSEIADIAMACNWYKVGIAQEKEKEYYDLSYWHCYCAVEMDDGSYRNLPTNMWCGYFETLYSARIVLVEGMSDEDYVQF